MNGKTHAICAVVAMGLIVYNEPTALTLFGYDYIPAVGLATAAIGAYAPDVDIQGSTASHKAPIFAKLLTHRGFTHTLAMPVVIFVLMHYLSSLCIPVVPSLLLGIEVGWIDHVFVDLFNRKGVPLFWPIFKKKIHIATFTTGTWQESVFTVLYLGVSACLCFMIYKGTI